MDAFLILRFGFGCASAVSVMNSRRFVLRYLRSRANARVWPAICGWAVGSVVGSASSGGIGASYRSSRPLGGILRKGGRWRDKAWGRWRLRG